MKKKQIIDDLEKPKRKRGRPPKLKFPEIDILHIENNTCELNEEMSEQKK